MPYPAMGLLSAGAIGLLLLPGFRAEGLGVPISFQLAAGDWSAWLLVIILVAVTLTLAIRMAAWGRWASAGALFLSIVGLGIIASTDPTSLDHFFVFLCTAAVTVTWLVLIAQDLEDDLLTWVARGAMAGVALSFAFMGVGERVLVISALVGANLLYYGYFCD